MGPLEPLLIIFGVLRGLESILFNCGRIGTFYLGNDFRLFNRSLWLRSKLLPPGLALGSAAVFTLILSVPLGIIRAAIITLSLGFDLT